MANSEARGTAKVVHLRPAPQVEGLIVTEGTPADWADAGGEEGPERENEFGEKVVTLQAEPLESWRLL